MIQKFLQLFVFYFDFLITTKMYAHVTREMYILDSNKYVWKIESDGKIELYTKKYNIKKMWEHEILLKNNMLLTNYMCGYFCETCDSNYSIDDGNNRFITEIDVEKYAIFDITEHYKHGSDHTCIYYIERNGITPVQVHSLLIVHEEGLFLNHTKSVNVDGEIYEHIFGGYIKTDLGYYQLIKNEAAISCDAIFENIFLPVIQRGDNFYIGDVCITGFDFMRPPQIKSAR